MIENSLISNKISLFFNQLSKTRAALIDMDGVLYDSMKYHTLAWYKMISELGIPCDRDEFYLFEGMTGAATIDLLMRRHFGHGVSEEETKRLYAKKTEYFHQLGNREPMPGADILLKTLQDNGINRILVTGSGQKSIIDGLNMDYPGAFPPGHRVTAADVSHGKPDPEPYLKGLELANVPAENAIVIENAPLGVRAGKAAGIFTIAVTTGPIPRTEFEKEGADIIFPNMKIFTENVCTFFKRFKC